MRRRAVATITISGNRDEDEFLLPSRELAFDENGAHEFPGIARGRSRVPLRGDKGLADREKPCER